MFLYWMDQSRSEHLDWLVVLSCIRETLYQFVVVIVEVEREFCGTVRHH